MKRGVLGMLLLAVGIAAPLAAGAQVSAYGEFSGTILTNLSGRQAAYGATTGVLIDGPRMGGRVLLSADIQGRFIGRSGVRIDGVTVGPRFSVQTKRFGLAPFAEVMVGFARGHDPFAKVSTDGMLQANGGVTKYLTPRLDAVLDYSYSQFYFNGGEYNPKTFSLGAVYHFTKR